MTDKVVEILGIASTTASTLCIVIGAGMSWVGIKTKSNVGLGMGLMVIGIGVFSLLAQYK